MKQTVEEAVISNIQELELNTELERVTYRTAFYDGSAWQKEQQSESFKQMIEALQELLSFENCMRYYGAPALQYPDNFLKAIDSAKAALSAALD